MTRIINGEAYTVESHPRLEELTDTEFWAEEYYYTEDEMKQIFKEVQQHDK